MAAINTTIQAEQNYDCFIAELTALTRKYGVAIQSVGGVYLAD
jgi:glucokinase